jgi:hypothetical protein
MCKRSEKRFSFGDIRPQLHFVTVDADSSVVKIYEVAFGGGRHERSHKRRLTHLHKNVKRRVVVVHNKVSKTNAG